MNTAIMILLLLLGAQVSEAADITIANPEFEACTTVGNDPASWTVNESANSGCDQVGLGQTGPSWSAYLQSTDTTIIYQGVSVTSGQILTLRGIAGVDDAAGTHYAYLTLTSGTAGTGTVYCTTNQSNVVYTGYRDSTGSRLSCTWKATVTGTIYINLQQTGTTSTHFSEFDNIQLLDGGTPRGNWVTASAIAASTGADVTITLPAGLDDYDIFTIQCVVRDTDDTITWPSGWTELVTPFNRGSTARYFAAWKRAICSQSNPLVDKSTATGDTYCLFNAWRGLVTTGNPFEVIGSTGTGTADPATLTGITSLSANALIIAFLSGEDDNNAKITTTATTPAAFVEYYAESPTGTDGLTTVSYEQRVAAGATGTVSVDFGTANPVGWGGFVVAATAAVPTKLSFLTQPCGSATSTNFETQPVVVIKDAFGIIVPGAAADVTLAIGTGSGTLSVTTNPLVSTTQTIFGATGALFAGVQINADGLGDTLTASASGLSSVTSQPFTLASSTTYIIDNFQCAEAWTENTITGSVSEHTYLGAITSATDPYLSKDITDFAATNAVLVLRYMGHYHGPTAVKVYFQNGAGCASFADPCSQQFDSVLANGITSGPAWHTVELPMTDSNWTGSTNITQLRLDFLNATVTDYFRLGYLRYRAAADTTAPTMSSVTLTVIGNNRVKLAWAQASDNAGGSDAQYLHYEICQSTSSGACAASWNATYTLQENELFHQIDTLAPGTYYFLVRAVDEMGNRSTNTTESSTTLSPIAAPNTIQQLIDTNHFTRYASNPIIAHTCPDGSQPTCTAYDFRGSVITESIILVDPADASKLIMFFGGFQKDAGGGLSGVGRATANRSDPFTWTVSGTQPVFAPNAVSGAWDDGYVQPDDVIYVASEGRMYLYYTGDATVGGDANDQIGLATSTDNGLTWTRYGDKPVLPYAFPYETSVSVGPVFREDATHWYMLYSHHAGSSNLYPGYKIAMSPDGIEWTKTGILAVGLGTSGNPDSNYIGWGQIFKWNDLYNAFYEAYDGTVWRNMVASSSNILQSGWTKGNPILEPLHNGAWDAEHVSTPAVTEIDGVLYLHYQGTDDTTLSTAEWDLGMATLTLPYYRFWRDDEQ